MLRLLLDRIRRDGPLTVAAFMDLALYDPQHGYYATRARRSGRGGDFYTSVDAGPLFGQTLAAAVARYAGEIDDASGLDLVEAGAGNGRLMRDVLDALANDFPSQYGRVRVHLVERSAPARAMHREVLGPHAPRLATSGPELPAAIHGILYANELLDAMPVHVLVRRADGLREIFVDAAGDRLVEAEGPLSSSTLSEPIDAAGIEVPLGTRAEVSPAATAWIRDAGARVRRGYVIVIDYGEEARDLRNAERPDGTLRAFRAHRVTGQWLEDPGEQDLTAHVDFTALDRAAREGGLELLERSAQAKFLIAHGALERLEERTAGLSAKDALRWRLAAKALLVPGSIGWTHRVAVYRKIIGDWQSGIG